MADLGFRPGANGFNFENYGARLEDRTPATNLTPAEMQRLFGSQVCENTAGGKCVLTTPASKWMQATNEAMAGGHCEGLAALSLLIYLGKEKATDYGGASTGALTIRGNDRLQREIALWWATQATEPTAPEDKSKTPSQVVDTLLQAFQAGTSADSYTLGIYKRDNSGGHAITPYAIEDRGGTVWILIYDNNYPAIPRAIEVDRTANTWRYSGSINPSETADLYEGDASTRTLTLTRTSARTAPQACPFCTTAGAGPASPLPALITPGPGISIAPAPAPATQPAPSPRPASPLPALITPAPGPSTAPAPAPATQPALSPGSVVRYNEIWVDGDAHVLITDDQGRRLGRDGDQFRQEIPGATWVSMKRVDTWGEDLDPLYEMPLGVPFTMTIDASQLREASSTDIFMIGPGYDLSVEDIFLQPGQKDTLTVSPDGAKLSYRTQSDETPTFTFGVVTDGPDWDFEVKGVTMRAGTTMNLEMDLASGVLTILPTGGSGAGTYSLFVDRITDADEQSFGHDSIDLEPNDRAVLAFGKWKGHGDTMPLGIDHGNKGTIDDTVDLTDDS